VPQVVAIIRSLDKINEQFQEEAEALREAEEVKRMVKTLEKAGFKIVKA
jgi:3-methyladenine DNA glycosylase Tag